MKLKNTTPPIEPFIGVAELALYLGMKKKTIYKWSSESFTNGFPSYRIGRYLRFKLSEIEDWLRKYGRNN